ncbi:MAG: molybdopterin-dependent oxidoreductase [Chloroflexi bacterium]|nr:molybdopterin-dependent oxidoreductase [Chloroflexota bacterium]
MDLRSQRDPRITPLPETHGELAVTPPPERWDSWTEYEGRAWPKKVAHEYMLVPTICFNCESGCGLLAYVDKETLEIRKFEGNPVHPASRGRLCAKGPATLNQINDPERVLYPMRRVGKRGEGKWERVSWDAVMDEIAARMRAAIVEGRRNEIMYHVGRPGEDGYVDRVLWAWGTDAHNSHTNICSSGARTGYAFWMGIDRPSPDYANARFILLISAHLESGHYFNPHAQRIIDAKMQGCRVAVMDPRLSNTASMADEWLPTWPGSEAAVLLAMARVIVEEDLLDREFVDRWTNWEEYLRAERPDLPPTFDSFITAFLDLYATFTPEYAEAESGLAAATIVDIARQIGRAGSVFSAHNWRASGAGNLGGWQTGRTLFLLNVLTGSVGTPGGTSPNLWDKFVPAPYIRPTPQAVWNELLWPDEYPLAHNEMSFLLPHFLREGRGKLDVYFTRVYNPVWTNPDGFSWIEALRDESKIGLHASLTPVWNETTWLADYVLPMGLGPERHDTVSYETHASRWLGFRQPVRRVAMERMGRPVRFTYEANPGEVWEEDEFWIELSWRIDPDGSLGIRKWFESPYRPGEKLTVLEYYRWIFENSVPGLPEKAAAESLTPLAYMQRYGVFEIESKVYRTHERALREDELRNTEPADEGRPVLKPIEWFGGPGVLIEPGAGDVGVRAKQVVGVVVDGVARQGFPTPSGKLEFYSKTLKDWGWPEYATPAYAPSHVSRQAIDGDRGELLLLPTFRLPTLIHTRTGNAKWLNEISHTNPVWIHPTDAERIGVATGELVRVVTEIGHFVDRVWVTESIRPGIVACSHHMGRWRLGDGAGTDRWSSSLVRLEQADGRWSLRQQQGIAPWKSDDPDSSLVWWNEAGVHQNLTFPVHPDPVSGSHAWHQKVTIKRARPEDRYGDVSVDTEKSFAVYREWLALARPGPGPGGLRRPSWLLRPVKPALRAYVKPRSAGAAAAD